MTRTATSHAETLILRMLKKSGKLPDEIWDQIVKVWVNYRGRLAWRNREEQPCNVGWSVFYGPWFYHHLYGRWDEGSYMKVGDPTGRLRYSWRLALRSGSTSSISHPR